MTAYRHILCPVDFSDHSRDALVYAGAAARWYGAKLTVLHVFPEVPMANVIPSLVAVGPSAPMPADIDRDELRRCAEQFVRGAIPPELPFKLHIAEERSAVREIADEAWALGVDLVVMATHGRQGAARMLNGSVTESALRVAPCPVLVIPSHGTGGVPPGDPQFDHVLCAVDFSECSLDALVTAVLLAEDADAHLTLLNVVDVPAELREPAGPRPIDVDAMRAADAAARLRHLRQLVPESARTYCRVETMLGEGSPGHEILRVAAEQASDLIVMGVRGRRALGRFVFGSSTHDVLQGASCPVLIVHKG